MQVQSRTPVVEALASVPLFSRLPPAQLAELARVAHRQRFERGRVIVYQGEPGDTMYFILAGQVKVSLSAPDGQEAIIAILEDGDCFGELSVFDEQPRSASVIATMPIEVLTLRRQDVLRVIRQNPDLAISLITVLAQRLRDTDRLVEDAVFLDVAGRLAKRLLQLAEEHGRQTPQGIALDIHLTQQDLAAMIGASRESVNKQLGAFRDRGILAVDRQRITILRPDALRERASVQ